MSNPSLTFLCEGAIAMCIHPNISQQEMGSQGATKSFRTILNHYIYIIRYISYYVHL